MKREDLIEYKNKLSKLSIQEQKLRNLYLKKITDSKIYGPMLGYASIDKPWLQFYDEKIFDAVVPNMSAYEFMIESNISNLDNVALYYFGKKYNYEQLNKMILQVESSFRSLDVQKGDVVTVAIPNIPENVFIFYALNKIGAIVNMVDLRMKGNMLKDAINEVNSKLMVGCDWFSENINEIINDTKLNKVIITSPSDSMPLILKQLYNLSTKKCKFDNPKFEKWSEFITRKSNNKVDDTIDENDEACILYTSGTTAKAKGVVLTNKALNNMAVQYKYIGIDYSPEEKFMNQVPPFLAYNIVLSTHMPLCLGMDIVMLPDYEPDKFAENVMKYKINHVLAGPADWNNFLENEMVKKANLSHLRTMGSGSDKINNEKKQEINNTIKNQGGQYKILEGYGMTEVGSAACSSLPNIDVENSVGVPLPKMSIAIFDIDTEDELPYGEKGEICITGPTMMKEYFENKAATDKTIKIHRDGTAWIHTGDIGYMDNRGILYLSGRIKRVIVRHDGIKISPYDIEQVVDSLDFVESCCVVGVNDIDHGMGAVPYINVVLKDKSDLNQSVIKKIIMDKCSMELTKKYCIKDINILDELPLTPVGKVDYRKLTDICNELVKSTDYVKIK